MKKLLATGALAITMAAFGASAPAFAESAGSFAFHNVTGHTVTHLHVAQNGSDSYGDDILGDGVLPDQESRDITFQGDHCTWSFKVTIEGDKDYFIESVDLCQLHNIAIAMDGDHMGVGAN